ncbi:MAG: TIGR03545 family protein [Nitrospiria bacterium]
MKKRIRWPGLLVFLALVGLSYFLLVLFIDDFVKARIEAIGSDWAKAKVELDAADLSFVPLGLRLQRLQVTDRKNPMTNAVEIGEIAFLIDPGAALDRKIHIEEMTVEGLRLNTPRTRSGALAPEKPPRAAKKKGTEGLQLPALDLPDVKAILAKESLASLQLVEDLRQEAKQEEAKWKAQIAALPDKETFKDYEQRVKKLKDAKKGGIGGFLGGMQEVVSLQKEIKADIEQIRFAKKTLKTDLSTLKDRVQSVSKVPMDDINRLKEKYALSPKGLSNISRMLLREQIGDWTETAFQAYETLQPHLANLSMDRADAAAQKPPRGKGVDIHFRVQRTLPNFLVETANVSFQLEAGNFSGVMRQITTQQPLTGKPLRFRFSGQALKDFESITVDGTVNRIDPAQAMDAVQLKAQGHRIGSLRLSKDTDFPVEMKNARADFDTEARMQNG